MPMRFRPAPPGEASMLLLARDPEVIAATQEAARGLERGPPILLNNGWEVLARLFSAGEWPHQVICQISAAGPSWPALLATAGDPFGDTGMVVVVEQPGTEAAGRMIPPGLTWAAAEPVSLARALQQAAQVRRQVPTDNPMDLAIGLQRGEITVRYQPVVRIADRRPVLLEGLARWQRRDDAPLRPDAFVPLAERNGLGRALSIAVAHRAFSELATPASRVGASLALNLPLNVLLERDLLAWLRDLQEKTRFPFSALVLEMTETSPVQDSVTLRRALERLRGAGVTVLIDDMGLEEDRSWLISLPFSGIKLDRHLVAAMPTRRRARAEVQRLVRMAHAARMTVTAEGVSDARLWHAVAAAGVDHAQGYAIARPLPAIALPAWRNAWQSLSLRPRQ
ncbi:EAL domain-containing protein [Roseomonas marmotae]|uniref:EAL domain-containing protein n=1 Tax=Roseomonas marmotae TaxID=2768161 RepID=A0ABS3KBT0_9PROT|nr:EAL domain-containing protein [Roseomonas marmotae]MBO1074360.1 EAL domain-containing protein [Roseomonas marmotae]QTI78106.1 EAL domain-containing protein [Roseomonas marmotae]